jgi:cell division protein FtsN
MVVGANNGTIYTENSDDSAMEPIADFIKSGPPYYIDKKQPDELVQEVQSQDIGLNGPFESVRSDTVIYKPIDEETEEGRDISKKENVPESKQEDEFVQEVLQQDINVRGPFESGHSHTVMYKPMEEGRDISTKENVPESKQSLEKKHASISNEYYVQVGSWKNLKYAEEMHIKLKNHYPDIHIVEQNNFYKVRISGVMSKKQGALISENIEEKFNIKSLVVLKKYNTSLADAVRPFIGSSYRRMDCYGLIVRGLMNQGVKYHGHGGLREKLENLALLDGLPNNAYLNGEGLIEKVGEKIFSNSIYRISNTREETDKMYSELTPYLREGLILSFSTTTRGHTGIVSRQKDIWTYINSGVIDNEVSSLKLSKGVGEEFLKGEIKNWVVLASDRKEPLTVTLGKIDKNRLQDFDWLKQTNKLTALNVY